MKIVINGLPAVGRRTGIGNYTANLIKYFNLLFPGHAYAYYRGYFAKKWPEQPTGADRIKREVLRTSILKRPLRGVVDFLSRFGLEDYDVYFEPNFIPLNISAKKLVVTVHDFCFTLHPEWQPAERVKYFQSKFITRIKRADRIITNSIYIKKEALELLKLSPEMITPIPLGLDHGVFRRYDREDIAKFKSQIALHEPFILYVGTQEPRKNIKSLLDAYMQFPEILKKEYRLVLVGAEGWKNDQVKKSLKSLGGRAVFLGYREQREVAFLYNLASLFVFPSFYEGFGLPPLEAMASGCPVVVSNAAALPGVCGDAAIYVDPNDTESIAAGMQRALSDETFRRDLIERGLRRAKNFTWEKTARETLEVFDEVMGDR